MGVLALRDERLLGTNGLSGARDYILIVGECVNLCSCFMAKRGFSPGFGLD